MVTWEDDFHVVGTSGAKNPHKYAGDVWGPLKEVAGDGVNWGQKVERSKKLRFVLWVVGGWEDFSVTWLNMSLGEIMFMETPR